MWATVVCRRGRSESVGSGRGRVRGRHSWGVTVKLQPWLKSSRRLRRFSVGELAARAGVATSALRFYEEHGLIHVRAQQFGPPPVSSRRACDAWRSSASRNASGLSLGEIADALGSLPVETHTDTRRLEQAVEPLAAAHRRADRRAGAAPRSPRRMHRLRLPVARHVRVVQHRRSRRPPRRRCPLSDRRSDRDRSGLSATDRQACTAPRPAPIRSTKLSW